MYLTRFRINTARVQARRLLSSPQRIHAAVMSSFADPPDHGADGPRVLWRIDRAGNAQTYLYIVSPAEPDVTHLIEQAGWPQTGGGWQTHDYTGFLNRLAAGDQWAFRLTANPVHTIRRTNDEPTKITAHVGRRHQQDWLLARQAKNGFKIVEKPKERQLIPDQDVHELLIHDHRQLAFTRNGQRKPITLSTVTYDGRLEVTNPDALRHTLTHGLGRAKGYGCGLMTLAPAG
ncbi:MAG TPA: type I-E CRISPR-associated protein Cas6/Cse3/CasE [Streptosporangiaceae bacterium]|jgi:CRISPR system Cascade subunit CasE